MKAAEESDGDAAAKKGGEKHGKAKSAKGKSGGGAKTGKGEGSLTLS